MEFINTGLDERILKSLDVEHPSEELVKAMNKQGLVQKEVTVQGKNGTFTRKQWVKASEAKSSTKDTKSSDDSKDKIPKSVDGWDARTGIIKRIDKYLSNNKGAQKPAGILSGRALDDAKSMYGDYVTTRFGKISTEKLFEYAKDHGLYDSSKTPQESIEKKSDKSKGAQQPLDLSSESSRKDFSSKFDEIYRLVTNASLSNQLARNGYSQSIGGSKLPKDAVSSLKKQLSEMKKQASDAGYTIDYNHNCELKPKKEQKSSQPSAGQKLSPADAKKKTQEIIKEVSDKKSFMEKVKAQGITWKENDHEGINWMRCCMAMNKHFENGGTFDNSSTTGSSVNTSYKPFPTQTPQSIKDLYGKSKPKSPRLNATHIFETSKKSLADSGKLSPSSLKILKKAHFQVAMDNAYQTMLDKYKTGFERDAITGYIGFYIKNDGFGTSSKVDQIFDKLSKKYNMSSTELFDKSNKLYEEFMSIFDKYQVAIADNEFPEIKYELVSKVNRKYMNSK